MTVHRVDKEKLLSHPAPSSVATVTDAIGAKDGELFFLAKPDGQVPLGGHHGYGVYLRDTRYLSGYSFTVEGEAVHVLAANGGSGGAAAFEATTGALRGGEIPARSLSIRLERSVDGREFTITDRWRLINHGPSPVRLKIAVTLETDFEDVMVVRGLVPEGCVHGEREPTRWDGSTLRFGYRGADNLDRALFVHVPTAATPSGENGFTQQLELEPQKPREVDLHFRVRERSLRKEDAERAKPGSPSRAEDPIAFTRVSSDSEMLDRILGRGFRDLELLRGHEAGSRVFEAGLPWFATFFGRDSLLAASMALPYDGTMAEGTLRAAAALQGSRVDPWRDEQPGKILHTIRHGELARTGAIPHTPYYGAVDTTMLFVLLLEEYCRWTGSVALLRELWENFERALGWMDEHGDRHGESYATYSGKANGALINQGWKDSGNAMVRADGAIAEPPIALVEVQGYAYRARLAAASLYERLGDERRAERLRADAERLRERWERDFWLEEEQFYAMALEAKGEPLRVVSSNPGQALWSGIVSESRARTIARRFLADDLFTGWGVRTLSSKEKRYNPVGYHLGTVWPHDNALLARGLRRYGFDDEAARVVDAMLEAASYFEHSRLPETFAGYRREAFGEPVRYPVACHPQAWAAATGPSMLATLLGLEPDGFRNRLALVRPRLPRIARRLHLENLRVGDGAVDLELVQSDDALSVKATVRSGEVRVAVVDAEGQEQDATCGTTVARSRGAERD